MSHSPGPWKRDGIKKDAFGSAVIRDATGFEVALTRSWINDVWNANANLVASAPELLEACKLAMEACRENMRAYQYKNEIVLQEAFKACESAIAAAMRTEPTKEIKPESEAKKC